MNEKPSHEVKILAVEDDPGDFGLIRVYLRLAGYGVEADGNTVSWATSLAEAKSQSGHNVPDIILLDLNLPDSSGLATITEMRNYLPGIPIVVLSGDDNKDVAIAALHEGAQDYLVKGHYEHDALGKAVLHALVRSQLEARLRLMEVALNAASNAIVITDRDAKIQWANPAFTQLTGYTLDEALGHKPGELIKSGKQDQPFYQDLWDTILSGSVWKGELINRRKDGMLYNEELAIAPVLDQLQNITNFVAIKHDITERKLAEENLLNSETSLRAILDNAPYLIWKKDTEGRFLAVNKAFLNAAEKNGVDEVLGKTDFDLWPADLANKYRADDAEVMFTRKQKLIEELTLHHGKPGLAETFKSPILDINGNLLGTTGFSQDITQRKNAEMHIRHLAHYDALTDLPNRALFSDRLQQALAISKRDKARMALMFIDLDKFKPINDELGHHVGDLLLKEAALRMQDCVRESDTVARMGGDEFVVLLSMLDSELDALRVAEKIREALSQPFLLLEKCLSISSSIGIAIYPEHGKDETHLVRNADIAMYQAKEDGRNCVKLFRHGQITS